MLLDARRTPYPAFSERSEIGVQQDGECAAKPEEVVRCKECGSTLAEHANGIVVDGAHEHCFINPQGYIFRVRCYASVSNVSALGTPTREHTWFQGYAWSTMICARCLSHVGWRFDADASRFYALIVDRIDEG